MPLLGSIAMPEVCDEFFGTFDNTLTSYFGTFATAIGVLLLIAGGVYLAFVGWRVFKNAINKVG